MQLHHSGPLTAKAIRVTYQKHDNTPSKEGVPRQLVAKNLPIAYMDLLVVRAVRKAIG